ncbi:TonB-dependent receptor plug domain-containing protein [Caulobacter sp. NIBR2454]|uniref:TonB-dependent receptor plug domain-containing protein n=1 Tax=Caulobacter sp. NIBR2454 TaxID=3015996 RepID=UPI0022B7519C|nr:TonB-dependent receptor [Caulobacter sp. NIBR2454]
MTLKTTAAWAALAAAIATPAFAQTAPIAAAEGASQLDELIVTGTRRVDRTAFDAITPVDVVSSQALTNVVSDQVTDKLVAITPSFNVLRNPTADGQQYVRPATLRGLAAHHTLVLVNGKRFHRSAFLSGNVQAPDLASIPSIALGRIEVLRDGASAQYGSDAIAGVINLILSDEEGFYGTVQGSQYYEGDGRLIETAARYGVKIGDGGHLVASVTYADGEATSRTRQRPDAIAFQNANPTLAVPNPVQRWGQPEREVLRGALNLMLPVGETMELYGFGTYADSWGVNDFNWRNPATDTAYRTTTLFPGWNLRSIYPTGFAPQFGQDETDFQLNGGLRGELESMGLTWDASASFGRDEISYFLDNSINASFGPQSPRNFKPGTLIQEEQNLNLDFNKTLAMGWLAAPANLAFGAERRVETYKIEAGDPFSWQIGPGAAAGLPSGSNGFPGYSPTQAGEWDQDSWAVYADLDMPITDQFTADVAIRHEDFSTFGSTTDYKVAARYDITDGLAVRGAFSTGFRAPTPAQVFSSRTSQGLDTTTLRLFTTGRLSPLDPVAVFFGAKPLKPEESQNLSLGVTARRGGFTGSIDYYRVEVKDRLAGSPNFTVTPAIRAQLVAANVPGADVLTTISYFVNSTETKTQGLDVVGSYRMPVGPGDLTLTAAYNYNDTKLEKAVVAVSELTRQNLENGLPQHTGNLTADYTFGRFNIMGRVRYFGEWTDAQFQDSKNLIQDFGAQALIDLAVTAELREGVKLTLGAENLFDQYPDEATFQASRGLIYSRNAVYDTDGGRYYARLAVRF